MYTPHKERFPVFLRTYYDRWRDVSSSVARTIIIPRFLGEWLAAMSRGNGGMPPEEIAADALSTGALCKAAVNMGLHVAMTSDGVTLGDEYNYSAIFGTASLSTEGGLGLDVDVPIGVVAVLATLGMDTQPLVSRTACDGMLIMKETLDHPQRGGLVIAQPNYPTNVGYSAFVHDGVRDIMPVPYAHMYKPPAP